MPVVYEGMAGDPRGDLFQGLKLWISHRVPLRSKWVDLVKGNGGEVTQLESNADMLIADNIKRGGLVPPPESYSYQWIEFSVKNGQLENKDDYKIGQPPGSSRQIGSTQQTKATRNAFTVKDDLILTKWVTAREWKGYAAQGNEIYKELERQHPNHTWQSWRDRWVKKLKDRPRPSLSPGAFELELEQDASHAKAPIGAAATSTSQAKTSRRIQAPRAKSSIPGPSDSAHRGAKAFIPPNEKQPPIPSRSFFTEEEDQMLMAFVHESRDRGERIGGNLIYQHFAEEHPAHSWHSWRDRWVRHLSLRDGGLVNNRKKGNPTTQVNRQDTDGQLATTKRSSRQARPARGQTNGGPNTVVSAKIADSGLENSSTEQKPDPRSDDQRLKRQEETKRRLRAAKTLQRTWRGQSVRRDLATLEAAVIPLQSIIRGYLARERAANRLAESHKTEQLMIEADLYAYSQRHEDGLVGSDGEGISSTAAISQLDRNLKDQFYSDLRDYIECSGADVDYTPSIRGIQISLWDLFRISTKQECEPEHRDVKLIADELGLEWRKSPDVLESLQQCYRQNLVDFEDAIKNFDNQEDETDAILGDAEDIGDSQVEDLPEPEQQERVEDENLPQTSDAVTVPKEPLIEVSSPGYRSSPPVVGSKRSRRHADLLTSDPGYPSDGSRKRRRLEKNSVIPPTPEGKLGYAKGESQRNTVQDYTSPLKSRGESSDLPIDISSDEGSGMIVDEDWHENDGQDELPSHNKGPKPKRLEPETQDWGFTPQERPQQSDIYESIEMDDVSASQQLRLEFYNHTSPDKHTPNRLVADTRVKNLPSSASVNPKASEQLASGPRRSTRQRAAAQQSSPTAPRSVMETRAKKRALPAEYQHSDNPTGREREFTPLLNSTSTLQPISQPQAQILSNPPATTHVRISKEALGTNPTSYMPSPTAPAVNRPVSALTTRPAASVQSSPQLTPEVYDAAYVQAQVDHFEALGYKPSDIATAMSAAMCDRGPQNVALESLHKGLGLPQNERGIWTEKDDRDLKWIRDYENGLMVSGSDKDTKVKVWTLRNRLAEKHGDKGVKLRNEFLDFLTIEDRTGEGKAREA